MIPHPMQVRSIMKSWGSLLVFTASCTGAILESAKLLSALEYDFVVVGGGTAGNVIANRLTENPRHSVLVLEAGGSNENVLNSIVPFFCPRATPQTPFDWNFTTTPQAGLKGRSVPYPRGHILGGSSSVNFMGYTRGTSDDYDRYARLSGDPGWSWARLQPYFRKNERWTLPADRHNITGQFDPSVHGFTGVNSVSLPGFEQPTDRRVIQATAELPGEFPFNLDTNSGHHLGIGWTQSTIRDGERSSSATSYLGPKYIKRRNLHVLLRAQVSRLIETGERHGAPTFMTVEFMDETGTLKRVTATKEVILSAGSIGTPHILMNSGIGNATALSEIGIKSLVDLPSVGQNLSDHPYAGNTWFVNSTDTFEAANRNATLAAEQFQRWEATHTGPLADGTFNQAGWVRVPANSTIFQQFPDPSSGPNTAHFELVFANGISRPPIPPSGNFFAISTAVLTPISRGSVTLNSNNPFDPPLINPNFLSSDFDIFVMREAIRSARRFLTAPVWADYVISPTNNATTDAELNEYIRGNTGSVFHPVGTSSMSPRGARYGVVDPDLRVKGVVGLRVVDASVLPVVPAAHTQAATYVFAERAADLIKASW